jgi:hypothetical protein
MGLVARSCTQFVKGEELFLVSPQGLDSLRVLRLALLGEAVRLL